VFEPINTGSLPYFVRPLDDGRLAFTVDNHLIMSFNDCERKFWLRHVRRMRPKGKGGVALNIGAWWSAVLGGHDVVRTAVTTTGKPEILHIDGLYEIMQRGKFPTLQDFISLAGLLWQEMGMDELQTSKPKAYTDFGGAGGAVRMAHEYYTKQALIDNANWKFVGAELGFGRHGEVKLYEDDKIVIYYMGKPDLVVFNLGVLQPVEHKTIFRVDRNTHLKYKPHPQVAGYVYSLNEIAKQIGYDKIVDRCIVNIASRMPPAEKPRDGVRKPRFLRVYTSHSVEELEEWKRNTVSKVQRLYHSLLHDEWIWKESSCHLYGGCEFRGVDAVPPSSRERALASDFVQVEPWTPYTTDEDEDDD